MKEPFKSARECRLYPEGKGQLWRGFKMKVRFIFLKSDSKQNKKYPRLVYDNECINKEERQVKLRLAIKVLNILDRNREFTEVISLYP